MKLFDRHHPRLSAALFLTFLLTLFGGGEIVAQEDNRQAGETFKHRHQIGARLGVWANNGSTPIPFGPSQPNYDSDFGGSNFYLEGFFAYRLATTLLLESSIGIVNRGDVTRTDPNLQFSFIGQLNIYPILMKAKFYPLAGSHLRVQPYIVAGGGIYHGRQSIQFTQFGRFNPSGFEDTETDLNYVLGGGFDYSLTGPFSLNLNGVYMPIDFSNELITITDYQAVVVTFGLTYSLPIGEK